jgi:hypothetical protein
MNTAWATVQPLTRRDEIMLYICEYAGGKSGPTPSILEIAHHFRLAYSTIYHHIMKLQIEGRLKQEDGKLIVVGSEWYGPEDFLSR